MHPGLLLRVTSRVVADKYHLRFRVLPGRESRDGFGLGFYDAVGTTTTQARQDGQMGSLGFSTNWQAHQEGEDILGPERRLRGGSG